MPVTSPPAGRGLLIAGSTMMVLAVVGGFLVVSLLGSRLDLDRFTRDVVIDGDRTPSVPGTLPFSVDAPLDGSSADTMAVGIAVEDRGIGTPECTLATSSGDPVALSRTSFDPALINGPDSWVVVASARLEPGDYRADCRWPGEPSSAPALVSFTVGRTLDTSDVSALVAPMLGIVGVMAVAGLVFIVGLVLLIVGLVRRNRDRRPPSGQPGSGQPGSGQPVWGPPAGYGSPPPGWGPPGAPPTQVPPVPPVPPEMPNWPTPPGQG